MRKFSSLLAAAIAVAGVAATANADFILSSSRVTTTLAAEGNGPNDANSALGSTVGQPVDVITYFAMNDGNNGTGTKLNGINLTATTPGTTTATSFIFQAWDAIGNGNNWSVNTVPGVGGSPAIAVGAAKGSYIRTGTTGNGFNPLYSVDANGFAISGGTFPENRQDPANTGADVFNSTAGYTNNHAFTVQGGYTSGAPTATSPVAIGTLVVPVGTVVTMSGLIGGDAGASQFVTLTNGTPEPASIGILALGGLALVARRRKA